MKLYVSADIEGIACIAAASETAKSSVDYPPYRDQMTAEVGAACRGAYEGGVSSITVKDAHGTGRNIDPHRLVSPEGKTLRLIRGWSGHPFSMIQGMDGSFDALACVGFHSAASRAGNPLSHTVSSRLFSRVSLNGRCASEFYLFALAAATVGVPTCFLSGDKALCNESCELIEGLTTVEVFGGCGASVDSLLPIEVVQQIQVGMRKAVSSALPKPVTLLRDYAFVLECAKPADAYARSFYPGVRQISDRELLLETTKFFDVLTFLEIASSMS